MEAKVKQCPICKKPVKDSKAVFCSERCQQVDLHKWLSESYAIPGEEAISPFTDEENE